MRLWGLHSFFVCKRPNPALLRLVINLLYSFDRPGLKGYFGGKGGLNVTSEEKKSLVEELLRQKHRELGRLPRKDDFDEPTRARIKAFLGPWPRALESAGVKAPRAASDKNKKLDKTANEHKKTPHPGTPKAGAAQNKA